MKQTVAGLLAALVVIAAAGCTSLPESGPVVSGGSKDTGVETRGVYFDPPPPRPGASPEAIVENFLVAMTAAPLQTAVARLHLTREAAERWDPSQTFVYGGFTADASPGEVVVHLQDAHRIDARGTWRGELSEEQATLRFPVALEDDEWRIARAPNALILPDSQFEQAFRPVQVTWFDPSGSILVPEPVHVAGGESLSTALVRSLLLGPPPSLDGVVRTYLPEGLTASSVPVTPEGEADVRLSGTLPSLSGGALDRLVTQLAWTLRQVPGITSFRVTVGELPLTLPGGIMEFPIEHGSEYDPVGLVAGDPLYARARTGGLVSGPPAGLVPVRGAAWEAARGWRSLAVEPSGSRAAGVTEDGTAVELAPVRDSEVPSTQVASGAEDLLPPAWDVLGHLWLVDRRREGALVMLVAPGGRLRPFRSAGLSGQAVRGFLVSRDGSRLVAVVSDPSGDRLVEARVRRDDDGRVMGLTSARDIDLTHLGDIRVRDLAWRSPTAVSVLFGTSSDVSQVRTVSVDSGPGAQQTSVTTIRGHARWLVGSPDVTLPMYAVSREEALPLVEDRPVPRLGGVDLSTLTYVG